jgi:tetratricopeptide (TPR) repeat protein
MDLPADSVTRAERAAGAALAALGDTAGAASTGGDLGQPLAAPTDDRYGQGTVAWTGGLSRVEKVGDTCLGRVVARKRLPEGCPPAFLAREVRLLARLQHPNIVPLYEITLGADGEPDGYTMPLLTGETLRQRAARFHASRPARDNLRAALAPLLDPFADVCRAIEYAHAQGVWHLDLKGGNVQVDAAGTATVLDWNLAQTEDDLPRLGHVHGTPGYLAPEQAARRAVGPLTDVYGLGAVLYELLTGRAPFADDDRQERIRRALAGTPDPPSRHWPDVPPALDAICRKALAPHPEQRYASAADLRADVERWRNDEPVTASRESPAARAMRWLRRHPRAAGVGLTLLLATLPVLVLWLVQVDHQRRATAAALAAARANFAEVLRAGDRYFTAMAESRRLKSDGLHEVRREILAEGLAFYREFLDRRGDSPEVRREIAIGWARLAWQRARFDSKTAAEPVARKALELLRAEYAAAPDDPELPRWLAETQLVVIEAAQDQGRLAEALAGYDQVEHWLSRVPESHRESADYLRTRGHALRARGLALAALHRPEGLDDIAEGRRFYRRVAELQPSEDTWHAVGLMWVQEASLASSFNRPAVARAALAEAEAVYDRLMSQPDPVSYVRLSAAAVQHHWGLVEYRDGNPAAARDRFLRAYKLRDALREQNPETNTYATHLASTAINLARSTQQTGPPDEALQWLRRAHELLAGCIDADHPNAHMWASAAEIHTQWGWVSLLALRPADAAPAFRHALDLAGRRGQGITAVAPAVAAWARVGHILAECARGNFTAALKPRSAGPAPGGTGPTAPGSEVRPPMPPATGRPASTPPPPPARR